jgi:hypothetical protein
MAFPERVVKLLGLGGAYVTLSRSDPNTCCELGFDIMANMSFAIDFTNPE